MPESREHREQRFRQIIDALFEIAEPGPVKASLWQAYQSLLGDTTLQQEVEALQREVEALRRWKEDWMPVKHDWSEKH